MHVPKKWVYACPRWKALCLIGSAQEVSEVSVLNVLNFCFMFPFFLFFILLLYIYIYENIWMDFLGFGLSIISHILRPLLDHGLRMKYMVPIRK